MTYAKDGISPIINPNTSTTLAKTSNGVNLTTKFKGINIPK